jgi:hypothetical protein
VGADRLPARKPGADALGRGDELARSRQQVAIAMPRQAADPGRRSHVDLDCPHPRKAAIDTSCGSSAAPIRPRRAVDRLVVVGAQDDARRAAQMASGASRRARGRM